jgi:membrane protein DedA with SNARE-associated domain
VEDILRHYGLIAVFAGTFLEGDVTVLLAGVVAHLGMLPYLHVLVAAFVAGLLRDLTCYALGRRSQRARDSRIYEQTRVAIERVAGRIGPLQIVFAPFIYGLRAASMIFWGVHGLPLGRFLVLDGLGCSLWATLFSGAGYLLSDRAASLVGEVKEVEKWMLGALVVAVGTVLVRRRVTARALKAATPARRP